MSASLRASKEGELRQWVSFRLKVENWLNWASSKWESIRGWGCGNQHGGAGYGLARTMYPMLYAFMHAAPISPLTSHIAQHARQHASTHDVLGSHCV